MTGLIAETLRADRDERNAAGIHDHWDDPAADYSEPAVGYGGYDDSEDPKPRPKRCMHRVPKPGTRAWGVCWLLLDRGVCPLHGEQR